MDQNQTAFKDYAEYYDKFYNEKDYKNEANFLIKLLEKYNSNPKSILELGSGTSKLSIHLANKFNNITCVDSSSKMLELAKKNILKNPSLLSKIEIIEADIRKLKLKKEYDLIFSFFHVASYCHTNECLKSFFKNASLHLKKNCLFIFDYWYGPSVLHQKPSNRKRIINFANYSIERQCKSFLNSAESTVSVNYNINFKGLENNNIKPIKETHILRYLFLNEIDFLAENYNFEVIKHAKWLEFSEPSINDWTAYSILRKK